MPITPVAVSPPSLHSSPELQSVPLSTTNKKDEATTDPTTDQLVGTGTLTLPPAPSKSGYDAIDVSGINANQMVGTGTLTLPSDPPKPGSAPSKPGYGAIDVSGINANQSFCKKNRYKIIGCVALAALVTTGITLAVYFGKRHLR